MELDRHGIRRDGNRLLPWHGTATRFRSQIQKHGLRSRRASGKHSLYKDEEHSGCSLESKPDRIYLSSCYVTQFALNAVTRIGAGNLPIVSAVVDARDLLPDEGFEDVYKTGLECLKMSGCCTVARDHLPIHGMWEVPPQVLPEWGLNPGAGYDFQACSDPIHLVQARILAERLENMLAWCGESREWQKGCDGYREVPQVGVC